ncbi:MAG: AAA family ATPase [Actinomycetota bacterium]|nr:AAA family ATPase [Actinomycetota bacterium]
MRLDNRPLLDNGIDRKLFVNRPEAEKLAAAAERHWNVLVLGERGSGKTTLLWWVRHRLKKFKIASVFVDAAVAEDAAELIGILRSRLRQEKGLPDVVKISIDPFRAREPNQLLDLIHQLGVAAPEDRRTVVIVDGMNDQAMAQTLFGRLRDELWRLPLSWLVAADIDASGAFLQPPANSFFDMTVELAPMSSQAQREMLRKRMGSESRTHTDLTLLSDGNPRRLLEAVREGVSSGRNAAEIYRARAEASQRAATLGRSHAALFLELEHLGPVSASDPKLLKRLGWTRERVVQLLKDLEREGLVKAVVNKGSEGRQRKLYAVTEK